MSETEGDLTPHASAELGLPAPGREDVGWLLVGSGAIGALVALRKSRRGLVDWLLPLGLFGVGFGILLSQRRTRMDSAEEQIMAELDKLDPIARAQVLKAVAEEQLGRLPGIGSSD